MLLAGAVSFAAAAGRDSQGRTQAVAARTHKEPWAFARTIRRRAEKAQLRHLKRLAGPDANQQRAESQTAFAGQDRDQAYGTLKQEFPEALAARSTVGPIEPDDRVMKYLRDDHAAIVVSGDADGRGAARRRRRLVVSALPLRVKNRDGVLAAVSTAVTEHAGGILLPENALTDVVVHKDLHDGIRFPKAGVALRPVGMNLDQDAELRGDRVFWANVATDTDFMVAMRPSGVETFHLLRARQSPERLAFDVDVPEGGRIDLNDEFRSLEIKDHDGAVVARVAPPMAGDADGSRVPAHWIIEGTVVQMQVDHRGSDVHYPVLVDPDVVVDQRFWDEDASIDFGGWSFAESNPGSLAKLAGNGVWGRGLNVWLPAHLTPPAWMWGMWEFRAPGDTYVSWFDARDVLWYPAGGRSCITLGILGSDNPVRWDPATVSVLVGDDAWVDDAAPWGRCAMQQPTGVSGAQHRYHLEGDNWNTVTRGNAAAVQWWAPATQGGADIDAIFLGGAAVVITDDNGPVDFWQYGLPSGWTNNSTLAFSAYASDNGLGMRYMYADIDTTNVTAQDLECTPDPQHGVLCPKTQRVDVSQAVDDGIHDISIDAADAVENPSGDSYVARVDTVAPKAQLSGPAFDLRDLEVGESSYAVHVQAYDEPQDPNDLETQVSGVASVEFLVDGQVAGATPVRPCDAACLAGDAGDMSADFTFTTDSVADGPHTLQVRLRDHADNVTTEAWKLTVVSGNVTNPRAGLHAPRRVTLEAHARRPGITGVRWEYRIPAAGANPAGAWTTIPASVLRDTEGSPVSGTTFSVSNGDSPAVSWNIGATPGLVNRTQPLEIHGVFSGGAAGTTNASRFTFDTKGLDGRTAREAIGPGEVNLLTGNLTVASKDVSINAGLADLVVNRTFNSRDAASDGPAGRGWTLSSPVLDQDSSVTRITEPSGAGYVDLALDDGTSVPFAYTASGPKPPTGYEQYELTKRASTRAGGNTSVEFEYLLTDETDGSSVILRDAPGDPSTYYPEVVKQSASAAASSAVYETPTPGTTRVKTLYAPAPAGVDCNASFVAGCRSLGFHYSTATTATGNLPADWGDVAGRLSHIDFKAYNPATNSITIEAVANYTYDATGHLRAEWDPRVSPALKTEYGYDANGLLISLIPPGEQEFTMAYAPQGSDAELGRLTQVTRSTPAGPTAWTVAYDVALNGANAPLDMTPSAVATWGQSDIPTDAAAIFPPDQVPSLPTANYSRAEVHYLNRDGYEVNVLLPGGELSTSERDRYGNAVRDLSARNRAMALAAPSPVGRSRELDTQRTYQSSGLNLVNEVGPLHSARLNSGEVVDARRHLQIRYDETKPAGSSLEYHLPTTQIVSAQIAGRTDADARTTTTEYDWPVRKPTLIAQDNGTNGLHLTTTMKYDAATGLLLSRHKPSSPIADDASTTLYTYYEVGGGCGGAASYALKCQARPAMQPGTTGLPTLPTKSFTYNKLGLVTSESSYGSVSRTLTTSYDGAGRETQSSWTSATGTAVPATTTTYDPGTGRVATRTAVVNGVTRTVQTEYDSVGQLIQYTDGTGQAATTTYDILGRPLATDDGKGTQTRTYDAITGRLTQIVDSQAGTFTATYNADGQLVSQDLPNGLRATYKIDEVGAPIDLAWTKTTGCSTDCTWLHFGVTRSIHNQRRTLDSTIKQETERYDGAGRLIEVQETPAGQGCTVRQYLYDANSNRTELVTHGPGAGGACDATSPAQTTRHTYDAADRLTDSGTTYDAFGRITQVPGSRAGGLKLTSTYFADDLVRSQTQGPTAYTYNLDPVRRTMVRSAIIGGLPSPSETSHYADDSDEPSWTATSSGHWSRNVEGIDGDLVATVDDTTDTVLQLTDLHGNVAATAATSSTKISDAQVLEAKRTGSNWSVDPVRALVPGSYVARVRQNDASGNAGAATTHFKITGIGKPDTVYRDGVLADAPEAYWRLGEAVGVVARDEIGAHNGTYQGSPTLAEPGVLAGDPDRAVSFDATNDDVVATDQPWRNGQFTVETWVKTTQRGGTLLSQGASSDAVSWSVGVDAGQPGQVRAVLKEGARLLQGYGSVRVDDGRWHHVAVSFSTNGTTRVSVDGVGRSTAAIPRTSAPTLALGFDDASGSVAANSGSASNDGTVTGATWTRSGRFGGALTFANNGDAVTVPDTAGLRATSALTVEAWVKPTSSDNQKPIAGKATSSTNSSAVYQLATYLTSGVHPLASVGSTRALANSSMVPIGAWSHVAMTWDAPSATIKLYLNGTLVSTTAGAAAPTDGGGSFRIGSLAGAGFVGSIDEVRVYQRVLAQAEIAADKNEPVDEVASSNPSAAIGMDDNLGNVLTDTSGNGRDVTLAGNMPGWRAGRFGSAIQFNGTNYGSLTDPGLTSATGMTLATWVLTAGTNPNPVVGGTGFGIYGSTTSNQGPGMCAGGTCLWAPASSNAVWTHITGTWDNTSLKLYVNGTLSATATPSTTPSLPQGIVGIGRDTYHSTPAFSAGAVDEIRIYARSLTATEISRDWNMSIAQNPGGLDPWVAIGKGNTAEYFAGQLDEVAIYPTVLSDGQISEHYRTRSLSTMLLPPTITAPAADSSVPDATPVISGTGLNRDGAANNLRVDVFNGTDLTQSPVQSLLGSRTGANWSAESAKGLPAGTYTAKATQSDSSGVFGAATRTFSVAGASDPETGYATSVRSDTPLAYWRLGETSGSQAADDRTGHPGTYQGGPSLGGAGALSADADNAPTLDGVDDLVEAPNTSGFFDAGPADFTAEAWIKTTVNGDEVIAGKGALWQLSVTADAGHSGQARFGVDNGSIVAYSTNRVDDGNWHHVVAVADRDSSATVYVDGIAGPATTTANTALLSDSATLRIGSGPTAGSFSGQIDEVALYTAALPAGRIAAHYRLGALLDSTAPNLTVTAPADRSTSTDASLRFTGTAGSATSDASALTVTVSPDPTGGPLQLFDFDEFGVPRDTVRGRRYGYLGGKQRSTELASGVIAMGMRSYVPTLGRFLQTDPIEGGSANPYDYTNQDPTNLSDLRGTMPGPNGPCSGPMCVSSRPSTGRRTGVSYPGGTTRGPKRRCSRNFAPLVATVDIFCHPRPDPSDLGYPDIGRGLPKTRPNPAIPRVRIRVPVPIVP